MKGTILILMVQLIVWGMRTNSTYICYKHFQQLHLPFYYNDSSNLGNDYNLMHSTLNSDNNFSAIVSVRRWMIGANNQISLCMQFSPIL